MLSHSCCFVQFKEKQKRCRTLISDRQPEQNKEKKRQNKIRKFENVSQSHALKIIASEPQNNRQQTKVLRRDELCWHEREFFINISDAESN